MSGATAEPIFPKHIRLGVNVDHVATLRNARGAPYPDPGRAAEAALAAGADIITAHLREDRRHIRDDDIACFVSRQVPLNLEMAATNEMVQIALHARPLACCIVPERREEITTEGGLDVAGSHKRLKPMVRALADAGIRVSLFIAADPLQVAAAADLGAPDVELHTGAYCDAFLHGNAGEIAHELSALGESAQIASERGLEVHAGHGLTYDNVAAVARIPQVVELQIGHFLVGESVFVGLDAAIRKMRRIIDEARAAP